MFFFIEIYLLSLQGYNFKKQITLNIKTAYVTD
jgi:hypothetical protein